VIFAAGCATALGPAGCGSTTSPGGAPDAAASAPDAPAAPDAKVGPATFRRHTISTTVSGPAFATVATLAGAPTVIVSAFGHATANIPPGTVTAFARGATLDDWTATPIVPETDKVAFPNQPSLVDLDGDGDLDLLIPSGFLVCQIPFIPGAAPCGGLAWYEQTGTGWQRHTVLTKQDFFYHHAELADLDGDHLNDLVTIGESQPFMGTAKAELQWLKGTATGDRFEPTVHKLADGGGSFPRVADLDGDGDLDVASAEFFATSASFVWFEHEGATWTRRVIDDGVGPAIQLALVPDPTGDGRPRILGANHVNTAKAMPDSHASGVFLYDPPADPRQPWTRHLISDGIVSRAGSSMAPLGAPGIFGTGDLDGDGDLDVAVSGDGDLHVYWLEQTAPGVFATHVLDDKLGQAGGMVIADLNGDGKNEIVVTGYEDDVIYVYERE
jgi:hypothetical protein